MYFFIREWPSKFCWKSHERNSFCERKRDNLFLFQTWNFKGWMKNAQANIQRMNLQQNTRKIYYMNTDLPKHGFWVPVSSWLKKFPKCPPSEPYLSDLGCWLRGGGLPLTSRTAWRCSSLTGTPRTLAQLCYMGIQTYGLIQLVIWGWPLIND